MTPVRMRSATIPILTIMARAIIGTVVQTGKTDDKDQEGELVVRIDDNVKVRVMRGSITRVVKDKKDSKDGA